MADLGIVASAYGTKEGDERYNPIADLDNNKRINVVDIAIVVVDFGKTFSTYKLYGLDFGPYTEPGQDPNKRYVVSEEQVRARMETVAPYTEWVRTFGCTLGMEKAGSIARDLDLKIAVGAWLDKDLSTNEQEISNLISIAHAGEADLLIVGNEVLLRQDLTEEKLIDYINRVKEAAPSIPVATADIYGELLEHPAVMNTCDIIIPNYYPFWEGIDLYDAIYILNLRHQQVVEKAGDKPIIIGETGWPSEGEPIEDGMPSPENASFYFLNFISWARANNISYFYFEAFDEPWKADYEGERGAHWGIWFSNSTLKPGMQDVFDNETMPDNWSVIDVPGGLGEPTINFAYVPPYGSFENLEGQVLHVSPYEYRVAVLIRVGKGWWTKPYWNNPLTTIMRDGSWVCDITTGGKDEQAVEIIAFLVIAEYNPPLMDGDTTLPEELYENSFAIAEVTRE